MDYNRIILLGRLTRDPELRYSEENTPFCKFRIAVNPRGRGARESSKPLFLEVLVWNGNAEACRKHLKKGQQVLVDGSLQSREWTNEAQEKVMILQVFAERIEFGPKSKAHREEKVDQETGEVVF